MILKKIIILNIIIFAFLLPYAKCADAPPRTKVEISFLGGATIPVNNYNITYNGLVTDSETKPYFGLQMMYRPIKCYAIGLEAGLSNFPNGHSTTIAGTQGDTAEAKFQSAQDVFVQRITINPNCKINFYMPIALGVTKYDGKARNSRTIDGVQIYNQAAASFAIGFTLYAGLGAQMPLSDYLLIGLEGRFILPISAESLAIHPPHTT